MRSTKYRLLALYLLATPGILDIFNLNNGVSVSLQVASFQLQLPLSTLKGARRGRWLQDNVDGAELMCYPRFSREDRVIMRRCTTLMSPSAVLSKRDDHEVASSEMAQRTPLFLEFENDFNSELPQPITRDVVEKSDLLLLASFISSVILLSMGIQSVLLQFEWAQDWRYLWPLIGFLYIWDGLKVLSARSSSSSLLLPGIPPLWSGGLGTLSGVGLLLGGASDAWLPVYVTGPNFITSAGIGQDTAAFLIILTAVSIFRQHESSDPVLQPASQSIRSKFFWKFWTNSLLMAQLYILGAGTLDEILSWFQDIIS